MKLKLIRKYFRETYTIGELFINDNYFCDTLEDKVRDKKIKDVTAIPYGTYQVIVNKSPKMKRDLPRLVNVPNYEGILIHRGNTADDTSGCILVGENKVKGKVINSTKYEIRLVEILKQAISAGDSITIEITK